MTPIQYERWTDFAFRMADNCFVRDRRPDAAWIKGLVEDFFSQLEPDDVVCIVDWDNSDVYPPGHPSRYQDGIKPCGCLYPNGHIKSVTASRVCKNCRGAGYVPRWGGPYCVSDMMSEFLCDYEPYAPQCPVCSSEVYYSSQVESGQLDDGTAIFRVVGLNIYDTEFSDPGCDCPHGHRSARQATACQKWVMKRDAMCRCEKIDLLCHEQWQDQWGGPVCCCVRAGLDCASAPSAGVVGFAAGDIRKMYPEGVPDWVFPPDEKLHYWLSDEENGTFAELPDSMGVVL